MLITYAAQNPKKEISVVAETIPQIKRGALRDFIKIMEWTDNFVPSRFNKSSLTYTFANGSFIEFFSADQPEKLRGARRDVLFVNEANNVDWEAFHQLAIRTRDFIYIDYNPTIEFWAHTEIIGKPDADFIILTYRDNEALPEQIKSEMEKAIEKAKTSDYWRNWVRVYVEGQVGQLQGVVFSNWQQVDEIDSSATYLCTGLDFGFSNDPTAAVDIYKLDGKIIVDQVIYQTGLTNPEIAKILKERTRKVIADSAEPKSITEIQRAGVSISPAPKGPDSIMHGIQLIQQYDLLITKRSTDLIKELRGYVWKTGVDGKATNEPIGYLNHCVDALRYAFTTMQPKKTGRYSIR
jgi:phage terminase large subunit